MIEATFNAVTPTPIIAEFEAIIFDAYIDNDDFYLTDEQLNNAYQEYKKYRNLWK